MVERMFDDMQEHGHRERAAIIGDAVQVLLDVAKDPVLVGGPELSDLMAVMGELSQSIDGARVALVGEALERGIIAESLAASAVDWVMQSSPTLSASEAKAVVEVAQAGARSMTAPVAEAVRAGRLGVGDARVVVQEFGRLETELIPDAAPVVLQGLLQMGCDDGARGVRALRRRIVAEYGATGRLERTEASLRLRRGLSSGWDDDGLREYALRLDPEAAAILESALTPLSAPQPSTESGPDLRPRDQRRADALIELITRAVKSAPSVPVTSKATVVVTMDVDRLRKQIGAGQTLDPSGPTEGLLSAGTVRRLACDAELVPMVLGGRGQVLDVGRSQRLATPAMVKALWQRDGGCSFPGCHRPATWCDAHHVVHWADGGPTALNNLALLCQRHHTRVHDKDLTASVDATGVTWHV